LLQFGVAEVLADVVVFVLVDQLSHPVEVARHVYTEDGFGNVFRIVVAQILDGFS
jgi:hypothetical protein